MRKKVGNKLRDLLSIEAKKERRAYKRATLLLTITVLVGLLWLGFSTFNVIKLGRESSNLKTQIQQQMTELNRLQNNINQANRELVDTTQRLEVAKKGLTEAEKALKSIAAGTEKPKTRARRALQKVANVSKSVNTPKNANIQPLPSPNGSPTKKPENTLSINSGTIRGVVVDRNGNPISSVLIIIFNGSTMRSQIQTRTDSSGRFFLQNLEPGVYTVLFHHSMFNQSSSTVFVSLDKGAYINTTLTEKSGDP